MDRMIIGVVRSTLLADYANAARERGGATLSVIDNCVHTSHGI